MNPTKYLLIGGGLASGQAAKQLREKDPDGPILLVGEEPYVPYDRPPLSKEFLRGEKSRDELFFDPEPYFHDHRTSSTSTSSSPATRASAIRSSFGAASRTNLSPSSFAIKGLL